ncbi:MAG: glycosyltransferase family 2 protein [Patescibacteria group bacterium]|jgi:hypothetical protein
MKKVAIIIVNFNGQKYLPGLLGSIFNNPPQTVNQQVIFVDNASHDESVEYVRENFSQIVVLEQEINWGFAKGNNLGIKYAQAHNFDYVFLLNSDALLEVGCLDILVNRIEQSNQIAAVQSKILLWPLTDLINSVGNVIHYLGFGYTNGHKTPNTIHDPAQLDNTRSSSAGQHTINEINYCSGAACLIKLEVLNKIGLFNEGFFMYHEDLDLGWRFLLSGYKNQVVPEAIVYHKYEFSRSIKKFYFMERNRWLVILANYDLRTLLLIFPALLVMEIGLFIFSFKNGWWREKIKIYLYFLKPTSWQKLCQTRRKIQSSRIVKDREIVVNFSGVIEHQEVNSWLMEKVINKIFNAYWLVIKKLIIW